MDKHPALTLTRIERVVAELAGQLWSDPQPLTVALTQSLEPISYAEAVARTYTPIALGHRWGPVWSTAWFRLTGPLPAAWAGDTVAVLLDTSSEALVWVDGAPAQGLDSNRQDFVLTPAQLATGTLELYVEAAGNHLGGIGGMIAAVPALESDTPFVLRQASLARLDDARWGLYQDLRVLVDLARSLPEEAPRRAHLLFALNAAVNAYRRAGADGIPAARALLAAEFAAPPVASQGTVNVLGHSHIDTAWLWPIRETIRKCSRTFATVLKYMEQYPDYRYVQSQPQLYAFVKEHYPALYARIKEAIIAGRWEAQGGMWVEADCNIPSGESLVRQFLYGTRFFRDEFGVESTVLWLPDVFGYSAALPQILKGCGIDYFMTAKINWNQTNPFPHHTFTWEGIDGSQVLTQFLLSGDYNGKMTPADIQGQAKAFRDKDRSSSWLYLYGYGDGGGGVTKDMLEAFTRMRATEGLPALTQQPSREWFPAMAAHTRDLCTWVGELYLELHRGTYTTQARNKAGNRASELLLREAELLCALSPAGLAAYPTDALETAWKLVLLNQFHDIIPGSSIGWVYEDSARDYARIRELGEAARTDALTACCAQIDTASLHAPLVVWNTLNCPRRGLVAIPWDGQQPVTGRIEGGKFVRTQPTDVSGRRELLVEIPEAPGVGYLTVDLRDGRAYDVEAHALVDAVSATARTLENASLRVALNEWGGVVSLVDKTQGRELIAEGQIGNLFQRFDDHPNNWDAWDIDPFYAEVGEELTGPAELTLVEAGPLRATIRVVRALTPRAHLVQEIRLAAGSARVDFDTRIDWQEEHALLKVAFPVAVRSPRATFEIQFGHVERPTHRNTSWDQARFEVPAHKWVDLSEGDFGVALLNDSKYGYDVLGSTLRLSLLRAPKHPDPTADLGSHHFTYSLLPHAGTLSASPVPFAGYDLNVPLLAQSTTVHPGTWPLQQGFLRLDPATLILSAMKRADDGQGIIVRLYEAFQRRGTARLDISALGTHACRTDLLERNGEALPVDDGIVEFPYRPFEIITLRIR
jgi:alpha-mannosidase